VWPPAWHFLRNWRDLSGSEASSILPLAPGDRHLKTLKFVSPKASDADYLRPLPDSPLATGGAGAFDPSLPLYVGAVPPRGVAPWDWERTWRMRLRQATQLPPKASD
jgi:hypothetical protein